MRFGHATKVTAPCAGMIARGSTSVFMENGRSSFCPVTQSESSPSPPNMTPFPPLRLLPEGGMFLIFFLSRPVILSKNVLSRYKVPSSLDLLRPPLLVEATFSGRSISLGLDYVFPPGAVTTCTFSLRQMVPRRVRLSLFPPGPLQMCTGASSSTSIAFVTGFICESPCISSLMLFLFPAPAESSLFQPS